MKTAARILFSLTLLTLLNITATFAQKPGDLKAQIDASAQSWQNDYNNQNADAIAKHYTDDAEVTLPDGKVLDGPKEVQTYYSQTFEKIDPKATISVSEVIPLTTDMVQVTGTYKVDLVVTDSGETTSVTGNYTNLSRKVDGQWKIFRSMVSEISAISPGVDKNR